MALAREVGSRNITCNAVAPGFIETTMTSGLSEDFKQNAVKMIPLGRIGTPDDVASAVGVSRIRRSFVYYRARSERERRHVNGLDDAALDRTRSHRVGNPRLTLTQAESPAQIAQARELFLEYAESLGFSLCFSKLRPGTCRAARRLRPAGRAIAGRRVSGSVGRLRGTAPAGARNLRDEALYLRPQLRGRGVGRALAENSDRRRPVYRVPEMRLDTVEPVMPKRRGPVSAARIRGDRTLSPQPD